MAEEINVALSDPTISGAEMEHSHQDNGTKAVDTAVDEGISEPAREGAEQEEAANGTSNYE